MNRRPQHSKHAGVRADRAGRSGAARWSSCARPADTSPGPTPRPDARRGGRAAQGRWTCLPAWRAVVELREAGGHVSRLHIRAVSPTHAARPPRGRRRSARRPRPPEHASARV